MKQKFVFLTLLLANVQILYGFHYPQYEDHPEKPLTQSITNYKSHPPFGLLTKKRTENQFGDFLKRKFNSLGNDSDLRGGLRKFNSLDGNSGLRKFQKATNSLRRNNIHESKVVKETDRIGACTISNKNEKVGHMRRFVKEPISDNDDDLKTLDDKIDNLMLALISRKFQQILDSVISDDYNDSKMDPNTNTENIQRRVNDGMEEVNDYDSSDESIEKDKEGSVPDVL